MKNYALKTSAVLTLLSAATSLSASETPYNNKPPSAFQHKQQSSSSTSSPSSQRQPQPLNSGMLRNGSRTSLESSITFSF